LIEKRNGKAYWITKCQRCSMDLFQEVPTNQPLKLGEQCPRCLDFLNIDTRLFKKEWMEFRKKEGLDGENGYEKWHGR